MHIEAVRAIALRRRRFFLRVAGGVLLVRRGAGADDATPLELTATPLARIVQQAA